MDKAINYIMVKYIWFKEWYTRGNEQEITFKSIFNSQYLIAVKVHNSPENALENA